MDQRMKEFQMKLKEKEDTERRVDEACEVSKEELERIRKQTSKAVQLMCKLLPKLDESDKKRLKRALEKDEDRG